MTLSSLLTEERIKVPLDSLDKPGILREMCFLLATAAGSLDRLDDIHRVVVERESVLSTGVGSGIALPHGKCRGVDRLEIVAGTTREPVDFEAVDGNPVQLVVMMVGPPSAAGYHVKTLGHISRTLRDAELRAELSGAEDAARFRRLIVEAGA
jgi:PTS system nitrogen regulatory IIA component